MLFRSVAYVYDEDGQFATRCNTSMVSLENVVTSTEQQTYDKSDWHADESDEALLKRLLQDHNRWTGSKRARELLDTWAESRLKFVKVFPNEYKRALLERKNRRSTAAPEKAKAPARSEAVAAK